MGNADADRNVEPLIQRQHEADRFVAMANDDVKSMLGAVVEQFALDLEPKALERTVRKTEIVYVLSAAGRLILDRRSLEVKGCYLKLLAWQGDDNLFGEIFGIVCAIMAFGKELENSDAAIGHSQCTQMDQERVLTASWFR